MKRLCTILVSLILSMVIVYLGGGMVVVECLRNNTVTVGVSEDDCCETESKSDKDCGQCMKTVVVKLHPMTLCKQLNKVLPPTFALASSIGGGCIGGLLFVKTLPNTLCVVNAPHSPPRLYLAMIRVLII